METISYIQPTPKGLYKYRRRTPLELQNYIQSKEIIKSLGKDYSKAAIKALEITQTITEAIQLTKLSSVPESVIISLLFEKLNLSSKVDTSKQEQSKLTYLIRLYLSQSQVTPVEFSNRRYFFEGLLPTILHIVFGNADIEINELTYEKILKIRNLITEMPNKNHANYKTMPLQELVKAVHKGTLNVPQHHLMATDTINKYIKRIKSLLIFSKDLGYYTENIPKTISIQKQETNCREMKAALSEQELSTVFSAVLDQDLNYLYKVLYFTGMRRSELYKCKVSSCDGILCFDLRSPKVRLKTKSSYRIIPIHLELHDQIHRFEEIITYVKEQRLTKYFSRVVKAYLQTPEKKTLYSLRHTFATQLVARGIQLEIVSELMGHTHQTMTMNRYVKGFPPHILKQAIESL